MNNRYHRGWFSDSHRHYLAAKGIPTKRYFMPVRRGKDLGIQRHSGSKKYRPEMFGTSSFPKWAIIQREKRLHKPARGFWTSTVKEDGLSDWEDVMDPAEDSFLVVPDEDAKVFRIESPDDVQWLYDNYPEDGSLKFEVEEKDGTKGEVVLGRGEPAIEWERVEKDFDAVSVTQDAAREMHLQGQNVRTKEFNKGNVEDRIDLNTWDTESTAWFKPKFKELFDE